MNKKQAEFLRKLIEDYVDAREDLAIAALKADGTVTSKEAISKNARLELDAQIDSLTRSA